MKPPRPGMISLTEAADRAQVSRPTITNWVKRGLLPALCVGSHRKFVYPSDVDRITNGVPVVPAQKQTAEASA